MPKITLPLGADGHARVGLEVGLRESLYNALTHSGAAVPSAVRAVGLLDTSAGITCIDARIRGVLSMTNVGTITVNVPYGLPQGQEARVYFGSLFIPDDSGLREQGFYFPALRVIEADLSQMGAEVLIGAEAMVGCKFLYDRQTETFSLEW